MTTSSITAALPGTASSTSRGQSCPSACAIGHIGPDQRDLVLVVRMGLHAGRFVPILGLRQQHNGRSPRCRKRRTGGMRDYIGYLASVLVLCTFCARTMIPLRIIALASNVAFLAYGGLLHLYPVLLLHTVLMPVNVWRLAEIFRLRGHVRKGTGGDAVFTALLPFASRLTVPQGEVVIRKGEQSDCLYLVFEGALWVADAQVELGPGSVVGEWVY